MRERRSGAAVRRLLLSASHTVRRSMHHSWRSLAARRHDWHAAPLDTIAHGEHASRM
jgi:hypothetical protein